LELSAALTRVSVGYFHKDIDDYIATFNAGTIGSGPSNGYDGDYAGYDVITRQNIGFAKVEGWEAEYRHSSPCFQVG
jgi:iron complex outermembrane recepter protein